MENVLNIGSSSYEKAEPIKAPTCRERLVFGCELFIDTIKVVVLSIPLWFVAFYRLFVSPRKKSVFGQTVLVTKKLTYCRILREVILSSVGYSDLLLTSSFIITTRLDEFE